MRSFLIKNYKQSKTKSESHWFVRWAKRFLMTMGILFLISMVGNLIFLSVFLSGGDEEKPIPNEFILTMELHQSMPDIVDDTTFLAQFFPEEQSFLDFLRSLESAKNDDRVRGLAVRLYDGNYNLTQIQTIREAVIDFKSTGKKTIIYTDSFGGFSNGMGEYWLATAFDEIWVQPIGLVSLNGIRLEQPYLENALDTIGVDMDIEKRKEFKTASEMYTRNSMSRESRITLKAIVDDIMDVMVADIAAARNMDKAKVKKMIDQSPLLVNEALKSGLIDKIGYRDEFKLAFNPVTEEIVSSVDVVQAKDTKKNIDKKGKSEEKSGDLLNDDDDQENVSANKEPWPKMGNHFEFVSLNRYKYEARSRLGVNDNRAKVAVIHVNGMILESAERAQIMAGPQAFLMPDEVADAAAISKSIHKASKMSRIKVIVLRVNSPGGSPSASETIRHAVVKAKEKGKYVIVSMSDYAASGGYWISANGDEIIAAPLTLTGSIGVYGGKPDLSNLWKKLGIQWGVVEYGQNAGMWSMMDGYSPSERRRLKAMMDHIYQSFTTLVADGRDMKPAAVEKVAKGRAWTGLDAKKAGLVDHLGGFDLALQHAAEKVGIDRWETMSVINLPQDDDPWGDVAEMIGFPLSLSTSLPLIPADIKRLYIPSAAMVTTPPIFLDY